MFAFSVAKQNKLRFERLKDLVNLNILQGLPFSSARIAHKIFVNSIPKSGTNLLLKTIQHLPRIHNTTLSLHSEMYGTQWQQWRPMRQRIWRCFPSVNTSYHLAKLTKLENSITNGPTKFVPIGGFHNIFAPKETLEKLLRSVPKGWFIDGHMPYSEDFEQLLSQENFKMVFIIRDPRDIICSEINYFLREKNLALHAYYQNLDTERGMLSIIEGINIKDGNYPQQPDFRKVLLEYLPWLSKPYIYVTRFEDLVGPQGGGSAESQTNQIIRIAQHLEISISKAEAENIGRNLFGGTHTFRKGIIGSWKKEFSQEVRTHCKDHIGDLLIELEYEKDYDW